MKNWIKLIPMLLGLVLWVFVTGCSDDDSNGTGTLSLSLTDAPVDDSNVESVFITFLAVEFSMDGQSWQTLELDEAKGFNLLDLTDGISISLGEFELPAGTYTGLRFQLDAPEQGSGNLSNPGSFISYNDGTDHQPLFVPSGAQSGFKTKGSFVLPLNGAVSVTADFNVRKSVVEAGASGNFLLKPVIRIVVEGQAGEISGLVSSLEEGVNYIVYAYEDGTFNDSEDDDPANEEPRFPNAVTSNDLETDGAYNLPFLASIDENSDPIVYDLVVATFDSDGNFQEVIGVVEDVAVLSEEVTTQDIDLSTF